jgi:hypothetical protein
MNIQKTGTVRTLQNIHNSSTHSHASEREIALEIAAKISSVNGSLASFEHNVGHCWLGLV